MLHKIYLLTCLPTNFPRQLKMFNGGHYSLHTGAISKEKKKYSTTVQLLNFLPTANSCTILSAHI